MPLKFPFDVAYYEWDDWSIAEVTDVTFFFQSGCGGLLAGIFNNGKDYKPDAIVHLDVTAGGTTATKVKYDCSESLVFPGNYTLDLKQGKQSD